MTKFFNPERLAAFWLILVTIAIGGAAGFGLFEAFIAWTLGTAICVGVVLIIVLTFVSLYIVFPDDF